MQEEGSYTMEKKVLVRQSQGQCKVSGTQSERRSESTSNRYGFPRRAVSNGGAKSYDAPQARPVPVQRWDRPPGDRRQRQRICHDGRQREKVVEEDDVYNVVSTGSRKGNANHLLNFKFYPHQSHADDHRGYNRSRFSSHGQRGFRRATQYKKEQFLQASCQFVVRDTKKYVEQATDADALVDWKMVELVRSFSPDPVSCPICLQTPTAGKITKCGHIYCWPCIIHYIKLDEKDFGKCPICFDNIDLDELKSVQCIEVPDYGLGHEIELKLMRKSKGSTYAVPKNQWEDRQGKPMHVEEGENTRYMKLLVASCNQIKTNVIDTERAALIAQMEDAEESEEVFIKMALEYLNVRETTLEQVFLQPCEDTQQYIPGLGSNMVSQPKAQQLRKGVDEEKTDATSPDVTEIIADCYATDTTGNPAEVTEVEDVLGMKEDAHSDSTKSSPPGSPPSPPSLLQSQASSTPAAAAAAVLKDSGEQTETAWAPSLNTKDDYFFYQASAGQHIYLTSLNAQCLAREYGSLEASPDTVKGTIVAIERIFMTEDVRKRLRYLSHIPLTCEFHVVELKLRPPTVGKETLKFFQAAFDKRHKMRKQKAKEDKRRANKIEMEQRRRNGLYPDMQIPLDSLEQFPSHLLSGSLEEELKGTEFPLVSVSPSESPRDQPMVERPNTDRRVRNDSTSDESLSGAMSFAQMLKAGKTTPYSGVAWGATSFPSSPPGAREPSLPARGRNEEDSDGEGLPAPNYSASMSDAIARALEGFDLQEPPAGKGGKQQQPSGNGGGRKKRKERKILLSTMARTN